MCTVYWIVKTVHICKPYLDDLSCCFIDRWIYDSVMVVLIGRGKSLEDYRIGAVVEKLCVHCILSIRLQLPLQMSFKCQGRIIKTENSWPTLPMDSMWMKDRHMDLMIARWVFCGHCDGDYMLWCTMYRVIIVSHYSQHNWGCCSCNAGPTCGRCGCQVSVSLVVVMGLTVYVVTCVSNSENTI